MRESIDMFAVVRISGALPRSPAPALHCWCTSAAVSPPALYFSPGGFYPVQLPDADLREKRLESHQTPQTIEDQEVCPMQMVCEQGNTFLRW